MAAPLITSPANPLVRRLRALDRRSRRQEEGVFLVEGIRAVWQALESDAAVELLVVAPELLRSPAALELVEARRATGVPVTLVSPAVFASFAAREHPSGLAAVVQIGHRAPADLAVTPRSLFVALHEAGNPGNLGTVLRTLDAVGGSGLILIGSGTDPYHPAAVKASMGALFTVPLADADTAGQVLGWCAERGIYVVTTSSRAAQAHWTASYRLPCLLLFGSEAEGLPEEVLARGDLAVRIPMAGSADSLNLAVAVGVLLYEVCRVTRGIGASAAPAGPS